MGRRAGIPSSVCALVRIIQEKVSPTVGTKCMGTKSLSSLDSVFSFVKWAQGKPGAAELLTNADNVRFRRMRWGDLTKGGPRGGTAHPGWVPMAPSTSLPIQCLSSGTEVVTWPQARGTGGHPQSPPHGTGWGTCCCPQGWQCPHPQGLEPGMSPVSLAQGPMAPRRWPLQPHCLRQRWQVAEQGAACPAW